MGEYIKAMNKTTSILLFLCLYLQYGLTATDADRLCVLEKKMDVLEPLGMSSALVLNDLDRMAALEKRMDALELLCTARCGLERHCLVPSVQNGKAECPEKMPPGSKCSVKCNTGFIATPGKDTTTCKKDGFWTQDLQCEIPLVLVSGGTIDQTNKGDSSVEALSFYPSTGCEVTIPDMPGADGAHRTLHNLVYMPSDRVLACNGMTSKEEASCHVWDAKKNKWKHHSYPNKGNEFGSTCDWNPNDYDCKKNYERKKGRYAAEAMHVGGDGFNGGTYIWGGMVYDKNGHEPTSSIRSVLEFGSDSAFLADYWRDSGSLDKKRAFFCSANVLNGGILSIGGLGRNKTGNTVEKSVEFKQVPFGSIAHLKKISKFSDMTTPRSGHACTEVPVSNFTVIVTGGTTGFGQPAMASAEIFDWSTNSWKTVASMNSARFGHAVVAVGGKVFAIGGDDRNPNNVLATIEEYDPNRNSWNVIETKMKKPRTNFGVTLVPHSIFSGCAITNPLHE